MRELIDCYGPYISQVELMALYVNQACTNICELVNVGNTFICLILWYYC